MRRLIALSGVLLLAAPLISETVVNADPIVRQGRLVWFDLTETHEQIADRLGPPAMAAPLGNNFVSWQYKFGTDDHDGFSHHLIFRKSDGILACITRNFDSEQQVDAMFPSAETTTHRRHEKGRPPYSVRVRRLAGDRLLLAMGADKPGDTSSQIVLVRLAELKFFQEWLFEQLQPSAGER